MKKAWNTVTTALVVLIIVLAILLVTAAAGATLAYLADSTAPLGNTFAPGKVACQVLADGSVKNTGTVPAEIRAAVVVNWADAAGNVHWQVPQCSIRAGAGWTLGADGYYYYADTVKSGGVTTALTAVLQSGQTAPEGYTLQVQVLAEALQVLPVGAAPVWGNG